MALRDSAAGLRTGADLDDEMRLSATIASSVAETYTLRKAQEIGRMKVYAMSMNTSLLIWLLLFQAAAPRKSSQKLLWNWEESDSVSPVLSLRNAKMPRDEKVAIQEAIEAQISRDLEPQLENQAAEMALDAAVKTVHLSDAGTDEIVADLPAWCSPTGNCGFWFFKKTPEGYKLLIDSTGQSFTIKKPGANGFRDVIVQMQSSATDSELKLYRYAHGRYWRAACYDANWAPIENGVRRELKEPRITPEPCDPK